MNKEIRIYVIKDENGIIREAHLKRDVLEDIKKEHPNWKIEKIIEHKE